MAGKVRVTAVELPAQLVGFELIARADPIRVVLTLDTQLAGTTWDADLLAVRQGLAADLREYRKTLDDKLPELRQLLQLRKQLADTRAEIDTAESAVAAASEDLRRAVIDDDGDMDAIESKLESSQRRALTLRAKERILEDAAKKAEPVAVKALRDKLQERKQPMADRARSEHERLREALAAAVVEHLPILAKAAEADAYCHWSKFGHLDNLIRELSDVGKTPPSRPAEVAAGDDRPSLLPPIGTDLSADGRLMRRGGVEGGSSVRVM